MLCVHDVIVFFLLVTFTICGVYELNSSLHLKLFGVLAKNKTVDRGVKKFRE